MKIIKSDYFGQWELRANGVTQGGRTFKSTVALLRSHGDTKQQAIDGANQMKETEVWFSSNNKFKVSKADLQIGHPLLQWDDLAGTTWLNIRICSDEFYGDAHLRDWAEFQKIKNELCGEERDALEFYPKESRLHDTDNCYHLFVLPEHLTFPLGYGLRDVSSDTSPTQRLLVPHGT
tara:strand:+ start:339 stop:869 length:531 start_codon:yes stop_codon:yes gene_type:complete